MGRRRGNTGMTNINPYKNNEYTFATEESRSLNSWETWCYYRSEAGHCANTASKFYGEVCKQKHSCAFWTKTKREGEVKDDTVDEETYHEKNDYFYKILDRYFSTDKSLHDNDFLVDMLLALFDSKDGKELEDKFLEAVFVLDSTPKEMLPCMTCLMVESMQYGRFYKTSFYKMDGSGLMTISGLYREKINNALKTIAYFCFRRKRDILKRFNSVYRSFFDKEDVYGIHELDSEIKESVKKIEKRNPWYKKDLCKKCVGDIYGRHVYDEESFFYIWEKSDVSNTNHYTKEGKKANVSCALVIPIFDVFLDYSDEDLSINKLIDGRAFLFSKCGLRFKKTEEIKGKPIKHELYGYGKARDVGVDDKLEVSFLDFPGQKIYFDYPECFENKELTFANHVEYLEMEKEICRYYEKKLEGKKVQYMVRRFNIDKYEYEYVVLNGYIERCYYPYIFVYYYDDDYGIGKRSFVYPCKNKHGVSVLKILY